jgi:hypothetical protein
MERARLEIGESLLVSAICLLDCGPIAAALCATGRELQIARSFYAGPGGLFPMHHLLIKKPSRVMVRAQVRGLSVKFDQDQRG